MAELKTLVFGEGLMSPTLTGEKQITLRRYRPDAHDFKEGEVILGVFKDGLSILLRITKNTEVKRFSQLTDEEAQSDGFADAEDAFEGLREYYPDLKKDDLAATIRYEVYRIDGVPAVRINEHL